jgi:hypothetical protein
MTMRDLSGNNHFLSLNTVTVREQGGLAEIIDAVAAAGIAAIAPWRDQAQACSRRDGGSSRWGTF